MNEELKRLREERNKIVSAMQAMHEKAEKESRGFNADEDSAWAKAEADLATIEARIRRVEKLEGVTAPQPSARAVVNPDSPTRADKPTTRDLFRRYAQIGIGGFTQEERDGLVESRAFTQGTGNTGGFSVPQDFMPRLEIALAQYGAMWDVAEVINTDGGALMPWPQFNYTGQSAAIVGEGTTSTDDTTTPFSATNFNAYTYRSNMLRVSLEFLQDTAFDEGFIVDALGEALGRGTNGHFTTGTGSGQPHGIVTAAALGRTGTTGQTTSVIYDDLVFLIHSVDPAYRMGASVSRASSRAQDQQNGGPKVGFMMNDASVGIVRRLKDSQGLPIWIPSYVSGVASGVPDTLLGYPVWTNQSMAVMAANARSILFGRLDQYKIRRVLGAQILRLTERYADNLQVGFNAFMRCDGRLLDPAASAVKYYANSAT